MRVKKWRYFLFSLFWHPINDVYDFCVRDKIDIWIIIILSRRRGKTKGILYFKPVVSKITAVKRSNSRRISIDNDKHYYIIYHNSQIYSHRALYYTLNFIPNRFIINTLRHRVFCTIHFGTHILVRMIYCWGKSLINFIMPFIWKYLFIWRGVMFLLLFSDTAISN